ncbi:hypothetical protein H6G74_13570 [Nostoc spongiaeforme FACHB-130]|uniref:Uncharacterized protein n=1 Tax=Nostoc spongiaeforme FACHB-130 TaxID=1357510 RepID=A0ABR8FVA6_9NOSO|nr:hypothetical protein [Nostoc spongiaeforme]MBD2595351.1 hypothetical protein [Nostoc spongiaeforme FACHB-130]
MTLYYNPQTKKLESKSPLGIFSLLFPAFFPILEIFSKPGNLENDDAKNIETIIKAGKDNNVDEMEIELDRQVVQGLDIKCIEQNIEGINITLGQKGKTNYKLKVKYK